MTEVKPTLSGPRTQRKRPADFTGIQSEKLAEENAAELAAQSENLTMINAKVQADNGDIDFQTGEPMAGIEYQPIEINSPTRTIMVNTDIENMTFGRRVVDPGDPETGRPAIMGPMNTYTFKEGVKYHNVDKELADHLGRLRYLSYVG